MTGERMDRGRGLHYRPTPRERDIIRALVFSPGTAKAIAWELRMSQNTVRTHLGNIMRKVGVNTRTELAMWWMTTGRYRPVPGGRYGDTDGGRG